MNQEDPPKLEHLAPKWFHARWKELREYLTRQRVVEGAGIIITDAAGGGRKISADLQAVTRAAVEQPYGFQVYASEFTGEGDPPSDQGRRVRVQTGWIGTLVPTNISNEFVLPDDQTTVVYYECTGDAGTVGAILSVEIGTGSSVPADPAGTDDHAPATTARGLATVTVAGGVITSILNDGRGSRDVRAVVTAVSCGSYTLAYQHTAQSTSPDASSVAYQSLEDRLAALEGA